MRLAEKQHVANDCRARDSGPRNDEPKANAGGQPNQLRSHGVAPVNQNHTLANRTAVAKKVIVAAMLAGDPSDMPVSPCPDVQPPARRAPNPMTIPAPSNRNIVESEAAGSDPK